jgi:hypothetical protein
MLQLLLYYCYNISPLWHYEQRKAWWLNEVATDDKSWKFLDLDKKRGRPDRNIKENRKYPFGIPFFTICDDLGTYELIIFFSFFFQFAKFKCAAQTNP